MGAAYTLPQLAVCAHAADAVADASGDIRRRVAAPSAYIYGRACGNRPVVENVGIAGVWKREWKEEKVIKGRMRVLLCKLF
jgi:hypothetical protein